MELDLNLTNEKTTRATFLLQHRCLYCNEITENILENKTGEKRVNHKYATHFHDCNALSVLRTKCEQKSAI